MKILVVNLEAEAEKIEKDKVTVEKFKNMKEKYENLLKDYNNLKTRGNTGEPLDNELKSLKNLLKEKEERVAQLVGIVKNNKEESNNENESYLKMKVDELDKKNIIKRNKSSNTLDINKIENKLYEAKKDFDLEWKMNQRFDKVDEELKGIKTTMNGMNDSIALMENSVALMVGLSLYNSPLISDELKPKLKSKLNF